MIRGLRDQLREFDGSGKFLHEFCHAHLCRAVAIARTGRTRNHGYGKRSEFWVNLEPLKDVETVAQGHPQIEQQETRRLDFMRRNFLEHLDEFLAVAKLNERARHAGRSQTSLNEKQVVSLVVRNENGGWCRRCRLVIDGESLRRPVCGSKAARADELHFGHGGILRMAPGQLRVTSVCPATRSGPFKYRGRKIGAAATAER